MRLDLEPDPEARLRPDRSIRGGWGSGVANLPVTLRRALAFEATFDDAHQHVMSGGRRLPPGYFLYWLST
jgi:hypothetical protein